MSASKITPNLITSVVAALAGSDSEQGSRNQRVHAYLLKQGLNIPPPDGLSHTTDAANMMMAIILGLLRDNIALERMNSAASSPKPASSAAEAAASAASSAATSDASPEPVPEKAKKIKKALPAGSVPAGSVPAGSVPPNAAPSTLTASAAGSAAGTVPAASAASASIKYLAPTEIPGTPAPPKSWVEMSRGSFEHLNEAVLAQRQAAAKARSHEAFLEDVANALREYDIDKTSALFLDGFASAAFARLVSPSKPLSEMNPTEAAAEKAHMRRETTKILALACTDMLLGKTLTEDGVRTNQMMVTASQRVHELLQLLRSPNFADIKRTTESVEKTGGRIVTPPRAEFGHYVLHVGTREAVSERVRQYIDDNKMAFTEHVVGARGTAYRINVTLNGVDSTIVDINFDETGMFLGMVLRLGIKLNSSYFGGILIHIGSYAAVFNAKGEAVRQHDRIGARIYAGPTELHAMTWTQMILLAATGIPEARSPFNSRALTGASLVHLAGYSTIHDPPLINVVGGSIGLDEVRAALGAAPASTQPRAPSMRYKPRLPSVDRRDGWQDAGPGGRIRDTSGRGSSSPGVVTETAADALLADLDNTPQAEVHVQAAQAAQTSRQTSPPSAAPAAQAVVMRVVEMDDVAALSAELDAGAASADAGAASADAGGAATEADIDAAIAQAEADALARHVSGEADGDSASGEDGVVVM